MLYSLHNQEPEPDRQDSVFHRCARQKIAVRTTTEDDNLPIQGGWRTDDRAAIH